MAVVSNITRMQGVKAQAVAYAATSAVVLSSSMDSSVNQHLSYATLTGNMTINLTFATNFLQFERVFWHFTADTSNRTVTLGTGFAVLTSGGLTGSTFIVPAANDTVLVTVYDGAALRIEEIKVGGRGTTSEAPAYTTPLEITDQYAARHLFLPAQLTGALTVNATAVTKWIQGDEIVFHFSTDGTQRIVTFGTNILSSGTITIPANKTATARGFFNGSSICISNREISA